MIDLRAAAGAVMSVDDAAIGQRRCDQAGEGGAGGVGGFAAVAVRETSHEVTSGIVASCWRAVRAARSMVLSSW